MLSLQQSKSEPIDRWDFDAPLWDQCTFLGRVKYYFWITDPRLTFVGKECYEQAKHLRALYLLGKEPKSVTGDQLLYAKRLYESGYHPDNEEYMCPVGRMSFYSLGSMLCSIPLFMFPGGYRQGAVPKDTTPEKFVRAKQLYESAFHPDSGDLMNVFGRMSFQMPGGMIVTGAMLTWYRTTMGVVFWQWVNQSFNALVNFTNRNANSPLSEIQMGVAYVSATAAACATAIGFKKYLALRASPLVQRYVPFAAVAAANCVNIPLMRQNEVLGGVDVFDDDGTRVGSSRVAAVKGISEVVLSRILMCAPGMTILPVIMRRLETNCWFRKNTWFHAPFQTLAVGAFLTAMVPIACAIFPQRCGLRTSWIQTFEPEKYREIQSYCKDVPITVYFNKGL